MKLAEHCHIRWMIRRDDAEVIEINRHSGLAQLTEDTLVEFLRHRDAIGIVMTLREEIVGFCLYRLRKEAILIDRLAVAPSERRCGIGAAMLDRLIGKLHEQRRKSLSIYCDLSNLGGLEFLRRIGFRATAMEGDTVEMVYSIDPDLTTWRQ